MSSGKITAIINMTFLVSNSVAAIAYAVGGEELLALFYVGAGAISMLGYGISKEIMKLE